MSYPEEYNSDSIQYKVMSYVDEDLHVLMSEQ